MHLHMFKKSEIKKLHAKILTMLIILIHKYNKIINDFFFNILILFDEHFAN